MNISAGLAVEEPEATDATPVLSLSGVSKSFPGVRALHDVALSLHFGKVTALIGENGAGKSTIVKILTGIYQPDTGAIQIDGADVRFANAHTALEHGITAIHQETVLFDDLSVAENIYLGHAPLTRGGFVDWQSMMAGAKDTLSRMNARHIDPGARLKDLSIANRHLVAVARALSIDARIVIMDEPTAALSAKEIEELFHLVNLLKSQGTAILFISHKFDELFAIADRYVVFRDGEKVGDGFMADVSEDEIVRMMVGRSVGQIFPQRNSAPGKPVLTVEGLAHPTEFEGISFELRKGEILGFYGLIGAGRSEVMQAIFGLTKTSAGAIRLDGETLRATSPADAVDAGIVYVPEDRGRQGIVASMPIFMNVSLPTLARTAKAGILKLAGEFELTRTFTERLELRSSSLSQEVGSLSGGNQQKVVIAKWLASGPKVIILDEPTKGIDVGSKAAVHGFMAELVANGLSVIMVSSELPEVLGMSDRVVVMRQGRIAAIYDNDGLDPELLVRTAAGMAA